MDSIDRLLALEDEKNAHYRKRMLYLIPFNFFALYATVKYFQNIQRISKKYWPKRQKASIMNFFIVGTSQALFFTTFYIGGTLALLGINPLAIFKDRDLLNDDDLVDEKQLVKATEGMKTSDALVLRMFKTMGLSESTMSLIESDLRSSSIQ